MARRQSQFICQNCGTTHSKWSGKCDSCGSWNSLVEEANITGPGKRSSSGKAIELVTVSGTSEPAKRTKSGIEELDRVTGGGFVTGSAILVGGDPGIGKSTLLLQAASAIEQNGGKAVYISGEEAIAQVQLRAQRIGVADSELALGTETNVENIVATLSKIKAIDLIIIDSIQTMWTDTIDSAPGTVSQVRSASQTLIKFAKNSGAALVLVGHVTKDGQIAGPRVVEHMVDAVLYFEGDNTQQYRILRGVKNRFGPTDEIGVFEMVGNGLREIKNPSSLFLGERDEPTPGTAIFAGMEGSRPLLVEVQALVAPSPFGTPRRAVNGWDSNRLAMVLAVLEARCGLRFGNHDVYLNIAGGLKLTEPAADLAAAAALTSSLSGLSLPNETVLFGEISLSGAIRKVANPASRLKEAAKLGFNKSIAPSLSKQDTSDIENLISNQALSRVDQLVAILTGDVT